MPEAGHGALRVLPALARSVPIRVSLAAAVHGLYPLRLLNTISVDSSYPNGRRGNTPTGVRTQDNIKRFQTVPVPGHTLNEAELAEAVRQLELEIADTGRRLHEAGGQGIERLPGVSKLLEALREGGARWGICTSGASVSSLFNVSAPSRCR